jgi:hypothetical protein
MSNKLTPYLVQVETAPSNWYTITCTQTKAAGLQLIEDMQLAHADARAHRVIYRATYEKQHRAANRAAFNSRLTIGAN